MDKVMDKVRDVSCVRFQNKGERDGGGGGQSWIFIFFGRRGLERSCARTFVLLSYRRKRSKGFALVNMRPGCAIVTGRVGARLPPASEVTESFLSETQLQRKAKRKAKKKNWIKNG